MVARCLLCLHCDPPQFQKSVEDLGQHILKRHGHLTSYKCGQCKTLFMHKNSLLRHIRNKHVDVEELEEQPSTSSASSHAPAFPEFQDVDFQEELQEQCDVSHDDESDLPIIPEASSAFNTKAEAAKFLMNLRSTGNITGTTVTFIEKYVCQLLEATVNNLKAKTNEFLRNSNIPAEQTRDFINETFSLDDPFKGMESTQNQLRFFSEHFGLPVPDEKFLSSRIENRLDRELRVFKPSQVPETFQSVSLIDSLKMIVKNPYLRSLILAEKESDDGVYRGYKDGSDFKKNAFLQKYPDALRIVLYQDDLETASALGSKDVIHKLGCFYFTIQNLPPEESSKLSSIFLFALCYAEDLKKEGAWDKVLLPVLKDLEVLESDEGVVVELPEGGTFILRACACCLCADALSAHEMMGLMAPSATYFCRSCLISRADFARDSNFIGPLRTATELERHAAQVEQNPALAKQFGVKRKSPLRKVMRIPEDNVFDAFHDLVGVIQMILKLITYELICVRKLFSTADLNTNINMFVYGIPDIKNKPTPNFEVKRLLSSGHSLKQTGSQTFCLLRIFPFIITGVNEGDQLLELLFLLQDIVQIMLSFKVKDSDIDRLEQLIFQHNELFHQLFVSPPADMIVAPPSASPADGDSDDESECETEDEVAPDSASVPGPSRGRRRHYRKKLKKGINKLHHIKHSPRQFKEKGPMIRLWCARFEARHRIFKAHAGVQSNFKNIPKTMAQMFQLSTIGSIVNRIGPVKDKVLSANAFRVLIQNSPYRDLLFAEGFLEDDQILVAKSAAFLGEEYSSGLFVALKTERVQPYFALILDILVDMKNPQRSFLALQKYKNEGRSPRYNSYKVCPCDGTLLVSIRDLADHRPIAPWSPVAENGASTVYLNPRTVFS